MALFITFEGGEGSGKTLQARTVYRRLSWLAIPALLTHEPGGTILGKKLSYLLKWARSTGISPLAELILFNASRAQLVEEVIQPGLKDGKVVICDRYVDSTLAYQGYGRGLELETAKTVNDTATKGLKPDLTLLLDMSIEEAFSRKGLRRRDRFEEEDSAFHQRVRDGYLRLAAENPERWLVIDASQSKEEIAKIIWQKVSRLVSSPE